MESHTNFTFVESGNPSSRRGTSKGSLAKSIIRSHAMQQVWEQRRLQRAQGQEDSNLDAVTGKKKKKGSEKAKADAVVPQSRPAKGFAKIIMNKSPRKLRRHTGSANLNLAKNPPSSTLHDSQRANFQNQSFPPGWISAQSTSPPAIAMSLMDPFDTCAISLGPKESRYMNHYFQALSWRFTLPKKTWLRYAIHDAGLLHGVLAIAAAHYSLATNHGLADDALYHHGKTISHVQKCLEDPVLRFSDGVIGAIGRMVLCHLVFGNRQHFITHIHALQRSAEARGGLENLGMIGQLKYIIATCVAGAATVWWEDVPIQLRYPYGPLDYPAVDDIPDAEPQDIEWGSAFRQLNQHGFLSDRLLDICQAMNALNSVISSRRSWDESQQRIFGDQCNMLSLRIIYLKQDEAAGQSHMTTRGPLKHMRECVRLAVHFYIVAFQRDVPLLSNLSIQTLQQLRDSLYLTDLETSWGGGQLGELLLWVLIITAYGCARPQERVRAGTQLRKTAMQLGVTQWLEVKNICRRFIFLESAVEWKTWPLWKDYGPRSEDDLLPVRHEARISPTDEQLVAVH